jgi:predicted AAA+ superfamily ATPase
VLFWRDADGVEVDWIVERHNEYIPIEVKWTENPHPGDAKHIKTFLHEYQNAKNGYVVSRVNRKQKLADRIFAIPWQELPTILESVKAF